MAQQFSWKKQFRGQILLFSGTSALTLALVGILGFWSLNTVTKAYQIVNQTVLPILDYTSELDKELNSTLRHLNLAFIFGEESEKRIRSIEEVSKSLKATEAAFQRLHLFSIPPELQTLWNPIAQALPAVTKSIQETSERIKDSRHTEDMAKEKEKIFGGEAMSQRQQLMQNLSQLNKKVSELAYDATRRSEEEKRQGQLSLALSAALGLMIALIVSWFFIRYVTHMVGHIHGNILKVQHELQQTSSQLGQSSEELASSSTQSAASLEEMVASMEEIVSLVRMNSEHAKESQKLSEHNQEAASHGSHLMSELRAQMEEIKKQAEQIKSVTSVIDDIAFQTNLLALNAAVEAARAGEQGKGFAVVAEAVRSLSHKSSESVKEIEVLIHRSYQQIEHGYAIVEKVHSAFSELETSIKKAKDLATELATSAQEQSTGLNQISTVMNTIDQAVQKNAAQGEQLRSVSAQMNQGMKTLEDNLGELAQWIGQASTPSNSHEPSLTLGWKKPISDKKLSSEKAA